MKAVKLLIILLSLPLFVWGSVQMRRTSLPNQMQLPVAHVRRVMQDSQGYMWYATVGGGLCRDNGYTVDVMRLPQQEGVYSSLSSNVLCLEEDGKGRIWFGTEAGLFYVDQHDFQVHEPDTALRQESISSIATMRDGTLWAAIRGALLHLGSRGETLARYPMQDKDGHPLIVPCMVRDSRGELVGCASWNVGLFSYNERGDSIEFLPWGDISGSPQWMVEDTIHHCYWVATWGEGVVKYQGHKPIRQKIFSQSGTGSGEIALHVSIDREGTLWVCGADCLQPYSTEAGRLTLAAGTNGGLEPWQTTAEATECDSRGNVWVAGLSPTSFVLSPERRHIRRIELTDSRLPSAGRSVLEHIAFSGADMWFYVSRFGVCQLAPDGKLCLPPVAYSWPPLGLRFAPSRAGTGLWASKSKDLVFLRSAGAAVVVQKVCYMGQDINSLVDDGRGHVWVGGTDSLQCFSIEAGHPQTVLSGMGGFSSLCADSLGCVYCVAQKAGVMEVDSAMRASLLFGGKNFVSLCASAGGALFVASADGTAYSRTPGDSLFTPCPLLFAPDGERILKLLVDSLGHVWMLTDHKVREFDLSTGASHTFNSTDRDIALDFFTDLQVLGAGVAVAGPGAVCAISSDPSLTNTPLAQKILVASITYNSERHLLADTPERITLPSDARGITLELTTLDYLKASQVVYSYRTSPHDDWHALPRGTNTIYFSSLPARSLRLEVKAYMPGSASPIEPLVVRLCPESRLAGRWWLLSLVAVVLLALFVALIIYSRRRRRSIPPHIAIPSGGEQNEAMPLAAAPTSAPEEDEFLVRARSIVELHVADEKYGVDSLCADLGMSRSALYRKLETAGGPAPAVFIRNVRLRRAAELLREGKLSVSEVAFSVGFSYVSYFCRCFKDMYGVQPSQYK